MVTTFLQDKKIEKRNTRLLLLAFVAVFILLSMAAYLLMLVIFSYDVQPQDLIIALTDPSNVRQRHPSIFNFWGMKQFLVTSFFSFLIVLSSTIIKYFQLASGGIGIAERMNARIIYPSTREINEKRALNALNELALAAGKTPPPLYVLEGEKGINALAAGLNDNDAAVVLTQGCIRLLNRDEIQGVLAHELGHLYGKDSRLKLILMACLASVEDIALFGKRLYINARQRDSIEGNDRRIFRRTDNDTNGGGAIAAACLFIAIGFLGLITAKIIRAAILRGRERLADSMAVEWTRNPLGLASCLKKIYALQEGSNVDNRWSDEYSHLFFASPVFSSYLAFLDTHPSLIERITKLDPSWNGTIEPIGCEELERIVMAGSDQKTANVYFLASNKVSARFNVKFDSLFAELVSFESPDKSLSPLSLEKIPAPIIQIAHEPYGIRAMIYSFFLTDDIELRDAQLEKIMRLSGNRAVANKLRQLLQIGQRLPHDSKKLLLMLTLPILRELSLDDYCIYRNVIFELTELAPIDERSNLEELVELSCCELDPAFS